MATLDTGIGMSLSMIPPCMVVRVAFWWRLATLTPSTMTLPLVGRARLTSPSLPRSLPVSTTTRSPLRIFMLFFLVPVPLRFMSQHLRRQGDDAHEALLPQLAAHGPEGAGAPGLLLVVDEHGGVLVEADVRAVRPALLLLGADDDAAHDLALLDRGAGDGVLDRGHEDVADRRVAAPPAPDHLDPQGLPGAAVVGHPQARLLLDHLARSKTSTRRQRFFLDSGRVSA